MGYPTVLRQLQESLADFFVVSVPLGLHSVELSVQTRRGGLEIHVQDDGQIGPDSFETVRSNSYNIGGAERVRNGLEAWRKMYDYI